VKTAHAVCRSASPHREVGHIERLAIISGIHTAQRQQLGERDPQLILRVAGEVSTDEIGGESIETRIHSRMGRKHISGTCNGEGF
jgi:hypothetical protein